MKIAQVIFDGLGTLLQNPVFQTVVSGVLVFVGGDVVQNFLLKPWQNYKGVIGKIDYSLKFYANVITNPGRLHENVLMECSQNLRTLSCDLEIAYKQLSLVFKLHKQQKKGNIAGVARDLIRLSNAMGPGANPLLNGETMDRIRDNLGIPELE